MNRSLFHYRREQGLTLLLVVSVITFLMVCLGAALQYTSTIRKQANRSQLRQTALGIADGALEIAYANWRQICRNVGSAGAPTVSNISSLASKTVALTTFAGLPTYSGVYSLQVVDPRINPAAYPITSGTPPPAYGTDAVAANSGSSTTTYTTSYYYLAKARVTVGPVSNALTVNASRIFELQKTSPWQWAIFYTDALELHPGATMLVDGWVHTNGDLYTAHDTLTFQSKVTYGGNWNKSFNPQESAHSETPTPPHYDTNLPARAEPDVSALRHQSRVVRQLESKQHRLPRADRNAGPEHVRSHGQPALLQPGRHPRLNRRSEHRAHL